MWRRRPGDRRFFLIERNAAEQGRGPAALPIVGVAKRTVALGVAAAKFTTGTPHP